MPIQGALTGLPLVLPVVAELTTPAILGFEVAASVAVGALLVAYFFALMHAWRLMKQVRRLVPK